MKQHLSILEHNRTIFSRFLNFFTLEQLNKVPEGFNNNIIWNVVHSLATQQSLMYSLSDAELIVDQAWVNSYRRGTKPQGDITQQFVNEVDKALFSTSDQLKIDLASGVFNAYRPYITSTKMELDSIETTLPFILFHDGIHIGSILALAKLV